MRVYLRTSILILGAVLAFQAVADDSHEHPAAIPARPAAAAAALTDGEVRMVDRAAGKITIKHGAIPKLDMPPMTMAYRTKAKSLLDQLKPGDKIRFEVVGAGNEFTVTRLEKVK